MRLDSAIPPIYIEGYTDQLSYQAGDEIVFYVSTSASKYDLEIAKMGNATAASLRSKMDCPSQLTRMGLRRDF